MKKYLILFTILISFFNVNIFAESSEVDYYAIFLNGSRCGYMEISRQIDGDRVINTQKTHLKMERMGTSLVMDMEETAIETADGRPLGFKANQKMATMAMTEEGEILPDGTMKIVSTNAGNRVETSQSYPEGAIMFEGASLLLKKHGLKKGTTYSADVFIPSMKQALKTSIEIGEKKETDLLGRAVELVEVKAEQVLPGAGTIKSTEYIDENYKTQKAIVPIAGMNIEMIACPESFAKSDLETADIFASWILKSPKTIQGLQDIKKITYTLKPKNPGIDLSFPSTDHQKCKTLEDGTVQLTVSIMPDNKDAPFPYKGNDPKILEFLEETSYIQSNHPDIISLAEKCTNGKKNAIDAALAIEAFVSEYIEKKDLSVGYASALEVLKNRQGDCSEHALLVAALCRAVGIPARIVVGFAYIGDMFMGHAWTEAYIGDKWRGLDASMRELGRGFDVGRITMAVGNLELSASFNIATLLGEFTIQDIITDNKQYISEADSTQEKNILKNITSMMKENPAMEGLIRDQLRTMHTTTYKTFAEEQNLPPETENSLIDLLVEKQLEILDMASRKGDITREDLEKDRELIGKAYDEKISRLLSPEEFNAFKEYTKVAPERALINEFKNINSAGDHQIDKEKEKELIAAMYDERQKMTEIEKMNQESGDLNPALSAEAVNNEFEVQCKLLDNYLESAGTILSDSQMKKFSSFINSKKSQLEMAAKLVGN
jgi:hypothetical protein